MDAPLAFIPILQTRVWGGEILKCRAAQPPAEPVGESWEIADCGRTVSVVAEGEWRGRTLREIFLADRRGLCGDALDPACPEVFPLLLKLLDAQQDLSLQVHPPDAPGRLGKTEAWYVLSAAPGACIYCGFQDGVSAESFADVLQKALQGRATAEMVARMLYRLAAQPGKIIYLPAGTVHALGKGVQVVEIQQNSDTTYRLYDWGRLGLDGKPRPLHVAEAMAVAEFAPPPLLPPPRRLPERGCRREMVVQSEKFAIELLRQFRGRPIRLDTEHREFHILTVVQGGIEIRSAAGTLRREKWDSALVPAAAGEYAIAASPEAEILLFHSAGGAK
ncbi:MAG: class I mannose-6-phosphate isomerase [Planctomycetota bacterium]|nr:class I mannose-6-phosphate isomerase [Planctomycetota bacterium]